MPYPTKYNRQYDYVSYQNGNPNKPLPATKVNADLNLVQLSTSEIVDFLKKSLRADGKIMNGAVGREQIDPSVNLGFTPPVEWQPNTTYTADVSTIFYSDAFYYAAVTHTSGSSFEPAKWVLIADFEALADEAAIKAIASNPNLYAISQLASAADKGIVFTGAGTAMTFDLTSWGRSLMAATTTGGAQTTLGISAFAQTVLDDADGPTALNTLGALPKAGGTMTGALVLAADPASALQAATKQYVDSVAQGLDTKPSVIAATTANITLSAPQTIDGIAVIAGDRVLVKNQSIASQNGIYVVAAGSWTRAADADSWAELPGAFVFVERGTVNADCGFVCTVDAGGTIGSTNVTFAQFSGAGTYTATGGVTLTGTQFSLTPAADGTIKSNISGGSAAPTDNTISAVLDKLFGTTRGSVIYRGASGWAARAPGTNGQFFKTLGAGADPDWASIPGGGDMLAANNLSDVVSTSTARQNIQVGVRGHLHGLTLSAAGGSTSFGISVGEATDSTGASLMVLGSAYTKTTGGWAVGTTNGSLDNGSIANSTWYHVYQIKRLDTGVVDVLTSLSATAPALPTNYTVFRRIGSMKTDGSGNWLKFTQVGDQFSWAAPVMDLSSVNSSNIATLYALSVPTGIALTANFRALAGNTAGQAIYLFFSPSEGAQTANSPAGNISLYTNGASNYAAGQFQIITDTSSRIYLVSQSATNNQVWVVTNGWVDRRGRDN